MLFAGGVSQRLDSNPFRKEHQGSNLGLLECSQIGSGRERRDECN